MLHKLQHSFIQGIYRHNHDFHHLFDQRRRSAQEQIDISRNSIFGGLVKSLTEIYPVTQRLVGNEFFDALCLRYIARTPSLHPDINCYGQALAEFTAQFEPAMSLPYLPDVMRLEWAWHWALQIKEAEGKDLKTLTMMDAELLSHLVLILTNSASLIRSTFPVFTIWQANQPEQDSDTTIDLGEGGQDILVWRSRHELRMDRLSGSQADFLDAIVQQQSLADMQSLADFDVNMITVLQRGYISDYRFIVDKIEN